MPTPLRFGVIGAGRLGASLALALTAKGSTLVGFTTRSSGGLERARALLGDKSCATIAQLAACSPDLYILAVPDEALPEATDKLALALAEQPARRERTVFVLHTSGATSVTILEPCQRMGATPLAFHPLQTFSDPSTGAGRFAGIAIAVTPLSGDHNSPAAQFGFALARLLEATPFFLPDDRRVLYHAAATLASNYLVALEHQARRLFVLSGFPEESALDMFLPLVKATLDNIERQGTVRALTGPLSRGDKETVLRHLETLRIQAPDLYQLYAVLGLAAMSIVRERREVPPDMVDALTALLREAVSGAATPVVVPNRESQT
ncbi:MAG: DUF2520 domain-containing protein [Thermoleophilia bacterium]|nr:DUF2520 domain-containing protein [Thermoleophilia bacterium]